MKPTLSIIRGALLGVATGDALGVPFEFTPRSILEETPILGMSGFGRYNVPAGTWSDDSSLTFCLAESIAAGLSIDNLTSRMIAWLTKGYWSATGYVFDVGIQTSHALSSLQESHPWPPEQPDVRSNGNGALMRILPLVFLNTEQESLLERFERVHQVGAITHPHIRSSICCFMYLECAAALIEGASAKEAYLIARTRTLELLDQLPGELDEERRIVVEFFPEELEALPMSHIRSDGYVVHTLQAAFWCLLRRECYHDVILDAVNLGEDTDTVAAVAGGLAGLCFGVVSIPDRWVRQLARENDIEDLCHRLHRALSPDMEPIGRTMYAFYLAKPEDLDERAFRSQLVNETLTMTTAFTIISGLGYYYGVKEAVACMHIAVEDEIQAHKIAEALRVSFNQEGVGYMELGKYRRAVRSDQGAET
jgi:ADP-ribosylglycohydrolase